MRVLSQIRFVTVAFVALCALLSLPGAALAAKPVQTRETFVNDFSFDVCGPTVQGHEEGWSLDTLWAGPELDANDLPLIHKEVFRLHLDGIWTANGKSLTYSADFVITDLDVVYNGPETVQLPDGSMRTGASYSVHEAQNGIPIKIKRPGGGVVSIDAGRIEYDLTIVIFPDVDGVVTAFENVEVHGPHPLFGTDRFCQIINQYLT
jgi:hypothetical protein